MIIVVAFSCHVGLGPYVFTKMELNFKSLIHAYKNFAERTYPVPGSSTHKFPCRSIGSWRHVQAAIICSNSISQVYGDDPRSSTLHVHQNTLYVRVGESYSVTFRFSSIDYGRPRRLTFLRLYQNLKISPPPVYT